MTSNNSEEEELSRFNNICIDNVYNDSGKSPPPAPREPPAPEKYTDLAKYIQEKCGNKLKILNRSTFHQIRGPIIISFNHFHEKCYYHCKWLDILYQLSLKYGDQIEFIIADQIDLDVVWPHKNPIQFLNSLYRPEDEGLKTYAIDEQKRIRHSKNFEACQSLGKLENLCENLLSGYLYVSQPIPEKSDGFVKICVHQTYDELVTESTKDIFLIIGLTDYPVYEGRGPNYEKIGEQLKDDDIDTVYINGLKNYISFVFSEYRYPQLIFIPHNDKNNFIHYTKRSSNTESVLDFVRENIGYQGERLRQQQLSQIRHKPFTLPQRDNLNYDNLSQYIADNYPKSLNVLDRHTFHTINTCIIIYFMDFRGKGLAHHVPTLQRIYQVALAKYGYGVEYLIADLKDIDIIYPKWYEKYLNDMDTDIVHMFKIDRLKAKCKINKFRTVSSLVYNSYYFNYETYQPWPPRSKTDLVTTCIAQNLKAFISNSRKHIFLTIYGTTCKDSYSILNILNEIVVDVKKMYVKMIKMDAKLNYVPLEYSYSTYPVHFFIPHLNKDEGTVRYVSSGQSSKEILEWIRKMVNLYK